MEETGGNARRLILPSEAEKYWQYSRECIKQALEAETPQLRDQLLDLARTWTEAALIEELNGKALTRTIVNESQVKATDGSDSQFHSS